MESETYPQGHPMMAQPAMQQGELLGENLMSVENKSMQAFEYNDKGSMATIGRNKAVVICQIPFSGVFAWFVWMFVHLFSLIGFKKPSFPELGLQLHSF
jgi:NADH dehydrogenase